MTIPQLRLLLRESPERRNSIFEDLLDQNRAKPEELAAAFQEHIAQSLGLVCFSEVPDQPLMWAHYAEQHQGYVMAFELGQHYEAAKSVIYQKDRVPFRHATDEENSFIEVVRTKSSDWAYEQEVRLVCWEQKWEKDPSGKRVGYLDFEPGQVTAVWAGCRADATTAKGIEGLLAQKGCVAERVGRAQLDPLRFQITLE